eukprot:3649996-Amphidinium_carterae.1
MHSVIQDIAFPCALNVRCPTARWLCQMRGDTNSTDITLSKQGHQLACPLHVLPPVSRSHSVQTFCTLH